MPLAQAVRLPLAVPVVRPAGRRPSGPAVLRGGPVPVLALWCSPWLRPFVGGFGPFLRSCLSLPHSVVGRERRGRRRRPNRGDTPGQGHKGPHEATGANAHEPGPARPAFEKGSGRESTGGKDRRPRSPTRRRRGRVAKLMLPAPDYSANAGDQAPVRSLRATSQATARPRRCTPCPQGCALPAG